MDTDFSTQSQAVPSSLSTPIEASQELSPIKLKHQNSCHLQYSCTSTQPSNKVDQGDSDIESPKSVKKPIFTIIRDCDPSQNSRVPLNKDYDNYNRKEKSLGELSKKLLMMFGRVEQCVISLDVVTQQLGVERRRIYDIINILESLGVVYRKAKNSYQWKGLKSIYETITKLQRSKDTQKGSKILQDGFDSEDDDTDKANQVLKRDKSLGLLSCGFIELFQTWKGPISLEQAGRKLSVDKLEEHKIKTKIRRLYDIANVFSSLGLIKKTCLESKKPAYEWTGLPGLDAFIQRLNTLTEEKDIFIETSQKKKTKPNVIAEASSPVKQLPVAAQSDNNTLKNLETSLLNPSVVENLLSMMLNLYKGQTPQTRGHENESLTNTLLKNSSFDLPRIQRQTSSPGSFGGSQLGFMTPTIRKSVSIIQRADEENEASNSDTKRAPKKTGFVLADKTNDSGMKRAPLQNLESLEKRTLKKMHSFNEFGSSESTVSKPLVFPNKENFSLIAKSSTD